MMIKQYTVSEDGTLLDIDIDYDNGNDEVIIPDTVSLIDDIYTMIEHDISYLYIPASVKYICNVMPFANCRSITRIEVDPNNKRYTVKGNCLIDTVEQELILGGSNAVIPDDGSVTSIEENAFLGRTVPTTLRIPSSIEVIGRMAFAWCDCEEVILGDGVHFLDHGAFGYNDNLHTIHLPRFLSTIVGGAFAGCNKLTTIHMPMLNASHTYANGCILHESTGTLLIAHKNHVVPDGTLNIENFTLDYIDAPYVIDIPASVKMIQPANFTAKPVLILDDHGELIRTEQPPVTIRTPKGSFAANYAKEHGILLEEI